MFFIIIDLHIIAIKLKKLSQNFPFFYEFHVREDLDIDEIVRAQKAVGMGVSQYEKQCPGQNPGFNTESSDNCKARFGFCWNLPNQNCEGDGGDADGSIGIGLYSQILTNGLPLPKHGVGAGWTYYINEDHEGRKRAWVYVNLADEIKR